MDLGVVNKGLEISRRRKKWLLLFAALGFTGYGAYRIYHLPSVAAKRRRALRILNALVSLAESVSDSAEVVGVVSRDLKEFLRSDTDHIPRSLKQISKIATSEDVSQSLTRFAQAVAAGLLRGYRSERVTGTEPPADSGITRQVMDRLFSEAGSGFASVVVGSFARNLVLGYYSRGPSVDGVGNDGGSSSSDYLSLLDLACTSRSKELIADCIQTFVSTAVAVYLEKTMDINTYDELFSGLTNPNHGSKVTDILVSVCNAFVETLVKTSHRVLTTPNSSSRFSGSVPGMAECSNATESEFSQASSKELEIGSLSTGVRTVGKWADKVSSTLAVRSNRRLVLDVTGRVTFETLRSLVDFILWKLSDGVKRSFNVARDEVVDRGLEVITYFGAKSSVIVTICLSLYLHILGGAKVMLPV